MGALADAVPSLLGSAARRLAADDKPLSRAERIGLARLLALAESLVATTRPAGEQPADPWERCARRAADDVELARSIRRHER